MTRELVPVVAIIVIVPKPKQEWNVESLMKRAGKTVCERIQLCQKLV